MDNPTDPRIQIILDRISDLEDRIVAMSENVAKVDAKQTKQLKSSTLDFGAYLGIGIGALTLILLFNVSVTHVDGRTKIGYDSSQTSKIVLGVLSSGSAIWGFMQHHKAKRERER